MKKLILNEGNGTYLSRIMLIMGLLFWVNFNLSGQFEWGCATPDDNPSLPVKDGVEKGNCNTSPYWVDANTYIPSDQDMTPLTVKVNFIFWQREDGIIGNFQENNPAHNAFIDGIIAKLNHRISNLVDPGNSTCYGVTPDYIQDSKIRFDVQKYYIADGFLWDIENATPNLSINWYCPGTWDATYSSLVYQRLAENNVRKGINVFLPTKADLFRS